MTSVVVMFVLAVVIVLAAGAAMGPNEKETAVPVRREGQASVRRDAPETEPAVSGVSPVLEEPETDQSDPMT